MLPTDRNDQIKSMYLGTSYVIEPAGHPLNSFAYCGFIYVLKSGLDWITATSKVHTYKEVI